MKQPSKDIPILLKLPLEILLRIASFISCRDMSSLRLVSKAMRTFCDHPSNWRTIYLEPEVKSPVSLWQLGDLKSIISPHVSHIQSIHIWGVRDNIIYYILSHCKNLQHLTICGWTTLSDHSLRLQPAQSLKIKTLELIGSPQQANYISVDAYTLGKLMTQSPYMINLALGCEVHMHAETFVSELEKASHNNHTEALLQSLTLATRRTWMTEHVVRLINTYPNIRDIVLSPTAAINFENVKNMDAMIETWLDQQLKEATYVNVTYHHHPIISTDNMIFYSSRILTSTYS